MKKDVFYSFLLICCVVWSHSIHSMMRRVGLRAVAPGSYDLVQAGSRKVSHSFKFPAARSSAGGYDAAFGQAVRSNNFQVLNKLFEDGYVPTWHTIKNDLAQAISSDPRMLDYWINFFESQRAPDVFGTVAGQSTMTEAQALNQFKEAVWKYATTPDIVSILLSSGMSSGLIQTKFAQAVRQNNRELEDLLLPKLSDQDKDEILIRAASAGESDVVKKMLELGVSEQAKRQALVQATKEGHVSIAAELAGLADTGRRFWSGAKVAGGLGIGVSAMKAAYDKTQQLKEDYNPSRLVKDRIIASLQSQQGTEGEPLTPLRAPKVSKL